jgi:ABC-type multidrug transport system ATPase subunit
LHSTSSRARSWGSWAPTAPARRRSSRCRWGWFVPTRARSSSTDGRSPTCRCTGGRGSASGISRRSRRSFAEQEARIARLLETLELAPLRASRAETLSGGERRRLEIARALLTEPKILLLDEPFAGVDPIAVADIQEIVQQLRQRGISVLLTDHNVRETLAITDRSYIIFEGRILRHGASGNLVNDPVVRQVYLGEKFRMPELTERDES